MEISQYLGELDELYRVLLTILPEDLRGRGKEFRKRPVLDDEDDDDDYEDEDDDSDDGTGEKNDYSAVFGSCDKDERYGHREEQKRRDESSERSERFRPRPETVPETPLPYTIPETNVMRSGASPGAEPFMRIEYTAPKVINGQYTSQRIIFQSTQDDASIYDLTRKAFESQRMDAGFKYDHEFDALMLTSVDGRRDGSGSMFWEFYVNGEIGRDSIDKQQIKQGDVIEWRLAEETDGTCGGVPDFYSIKSALTEGLPTEAGGSPLAVAPMRPGGAGQMLLGMRRREAYQAMSGPRGFGYAALL